MQSAEAMSKEERFKQVISQMNQKQGAQAEKTAPAAQGNRRDSVRTSFTDMNGKKKQITSRPTMGEEAPERRSFLGPKKK